MKHFNLYTYLCMLALSVTTLQAQEKPDTEKESNTGIKFLLGAGVNMVGDSGDGFEGIFKSDAMHFSNPYFWSLEYIVPNERFSFIAIASWNKYKSGKLVDGKTILDVREPLYGSLDLHAKFYFRELHNAFEPYIFAGMGYTGIQSYQATPVGSNTITHVPGVGRMTINTGLGLNYWVSSSWGLTANFTGKFGLKSNYYKPYITNQTQLIMGVFYAFNQSQGWR